MSPPTVWASWGPRLVRHRGPPPIPPRNQSPEMERDLPRVTQQVDSGTSDSLPMLFLLSLRPENSRGILP